MVGACPGVPPKLVLADHCDLSPSYPTVYNVSIYRSWLVFRAPGVRDLFMLVTYKKSAGTSRHTPGKHHQKYTVPKALIIHSRRYNF